MKSRVLILRMWEKNSNFACKIEYNSKNGAKEL